MSAGQEDNVKKALIITTISGFVPQFEMNNVALLQEMGYEVHYASNFNRPVYDYDKNLFEKKGITTHHLCIEKSPVHLIRNCLALRQLKKILKEEQFTLIHCHNPMGGVLGRLAGWLYAPGAVVLYTAHGFHFYRKAPLINWFFYYPVEKALAHFTDKLITINEEDYRRAEHFRLKEGGSVWKIPGVGLDVERFMHEGKKRCYEKKELGFPKDSFLLLSVGELNRNKNHKVVIEAIARMKEPKLYYMICGRGSGRKKLERLIQKKGLQGKVKLLGYRKDIERILPAADCFLFPSKREGFGMAAVEAMAAGLPLITSDCRGTREYMKDGVTGIVCRKNCAESYKRAVRDLMNNPWKRQRMRAACQEAALLFSRNATENVMRHVYEETRDYTLLIHREKLHMGKKLGMENKHMH